MFQAESYGWDLWTLIRCDVSHDQATLNPTIHRFGRDHVEFPGFAAWCQDPVSRRGFDGSDQGGKAENQQAAGIGEARQSYKVAYSMRWK